MSRAGKRFGLISAAWFALAACGTLGAATHGKSTAATPPARPSSTTRPAPQAPASKIDHTLDAMRDEMQRSRDRLALQTGDPTTPSKPYYIEYRLLDLDERTITAEFGALISSTTSRNRFMSVEVRVGNYKVDSSNFITSDGFSGFLGSTGSVGIDHDYDSLREDLWLATDQAFKEALESYSKKQAFLNRLARAPTIDDFQQEPATVQIDPLQEPDWTTRNWEAEAKAASAALRAFPQIHSSRVTYHLIYATTYLMNTEGTQLRKTTTLAAIEASLESESDDGMAMHDFYTSYAEHPAMPRLRRSFRLSLVCWMLDVSPWFRDSNHRLRKPRIPNNPPNPSSSSPDTAQAPMLACPGASHNAAAPVAGPRQLPKPMTAS